MQQELVQLLTGYWGAREMAVNTVLFMHLLGALLLGLLVGYERSYRGRAAGMRTYGIVCMASTALTVFTGYPEFWYGGQTHAIGLIDPTRTVQGIVTGIGFLGAGVIMRDGMTISGLTTAASIWAVSAIGVLLGIGFYGAAISLALLVTGLMMWGSKLEMVLPQRSAVAVTLRLRPDISKVLQNNLTDRAHQLGYELAKGSFSVKYESYQIEWHFVAVALPRRKRARITDLADELSQLEGVLSVQISHARN